MPKWTDEQLEAINKEGCNIIVSAGAGSGKTAVLTERVITKIKKGVSIDNLLILTFTKAAAGEMKERIRKAIQKENMVEQLKLLDCAYITTFDSFALSVVKKYHYLINVSPNINIGNENIFLIEKNNILDDIFEGLYKIRDPKFLKMINDLCVKDDLEIRKYILNIRQKLDMKVDSSAYLENYINDYYNDTNISKIVQEYINLIVDKIKLLSDTLLDLSYYVDGDFYTKMNDALAPLINSSTYQEIKTNINVKLPRLPQGSEEIVKEKKEEINNIIKEIKDLTMYQDEEEIKNNLYQTKDYAEIIVKILIELDSKIKEFKNANDIYEFNDIALLSIKILKEYPEVCHELKEKFNEILVDEYQDTSDIQETFINLIANNNVYMVGDVKQSIYRFRNANPYIFKNKYDSFSKHIDGEKIDLNKNFRSRNEVINNINLIFNHIMDDNLGGANYYLDHQMIFGNNAYLESGNNNLNNEMDIIQYDSNDSQFDKNEIEAFIIARDIKDKISNCYQVFDKQTNCLRNCHYNDFVILMDRTADFELYKKVFEYENIPLSIYKDEVINNEMDNMVITNLLGLIKTIKEKNFDTYFRYLFTSIARSFLYELSDQQILDIIKNNTFYDTDLFNKCSEIAKDLDNLTPYQLLAKVIDNFSFYNNIIKIGNVQSIIIHIEQLLNLSQDLMKIGYDCYQFIEYIQKVNQEDYQMKYSLNLDNIDAVKIMTIHKSKGLEYPICYFSGLYKSFNISDLKEKMLFDNYFGIILPYFKEGLGETICKALLKNRFMTEEISEKVRLFYVALTRAREKIILILPNKEQDFMVENLISKSIRLKYRTLADVIYSLGNLLEPYTKKIDLMNLNLTKDYQIFTNKDLKAIFNNSVENLKVTELDIENKYLNESSYSKKTNDLVAKNIQKNIDLGLKIHNILENLDFNHPNFTLIENEFYRNKVKNFYYQLKNVETAKVYQEYEFMYQEGSVLYHGIIDLMLEYSDHIDIIDYKLKNISDDNYTQQLNGYKNYIKTLTNKKINIYLYSLIDENLTLLT